MIYNCWKESRSSSSLIISSSSWTVVNPLLMSKAFLPMRSLAHPLWIVSPQRFLTDFSIFALIYLISSSCIPVAWIAVWCLLTKVANWCIWDEHSPKAPHTNPPTVPSFPYEIFLQFEIWCKIFKGNPKISTRTCSWNNWKIPKSFNCPLQMGVCSRFVIRYLQAAA